MFQIEWHGLQASQIVFLLVIIATPINCAHYASMHEDHTMP